MHIERLVTMANDIGNFFAAEPKKEDAVAGIRNHMSKFWEKRMRDEIYAHLAEHNGEGLSPLVLEAVTQMAAAEKQSRTAA